MTIAADQKNVKVFSTLISTDHAVSIVIRPARLASLGRDNHVIKIAIGIRPGYLAGQAVTDPQYTLLNFGSDATAIIKGPTTILGTVEFIDE
jgi:hypothetical protein